MLCFPFNTASSPSLLVELISILVNTSMYFNYDLDLIFFILAHAVFPTQIISHVSKKMLTRKLFNQFHVGENGIHVSNFQKNVFFQIFN